MSRTRCTPLVLSILILVLLPLSAAAKTPGLGRASTLRQSMTRLWQRSTAWLRRPVKVHRRVTGAQRGALKRYTDGFRAATGAGSVSRKRSTPRTPARVTAAQQGQLDRYTRMFEAARRGR